MLKPEVLALAQKINVAMNLSQIQRDLKINPNDKDHATALCLVSITTLMPLLGVILGNPEPTYDLVEDLAEMLGMDPEELTNICLKLTEDMPE